MTKTGERDCLSRIAGRQPIIRVLAAAGAGPRAKCEGMVRGGRVAVNGQVLRKPQARADPFHERITLDGQPLPLDNTCRYLVLNKPYGVLCAFTDAEDEGEDEVGESKGRPTLSNYVDVPDVYAAGRLDLDSEGLLLLTSDGWLIHRLSHPRYQHPKTYLAQVELEPDEAALTALRQGVIVKGRRTAPAQVELLSTEPDLPPRPVPIRFRKTVPTAWVRLVLTEGQKRQVRRMTAAVRHPTLRLVRIGIGPLKLGDLKPGAWRDLSQEELNALRSMLRQGTRR